MNIFSFWDMHVMHILYILHGKQLNFMIYGEIKKTGSPLLVANARNSWSSRTFCTKHLLIPLTIMVIMVTMVIMVIMILVIVMVMMIMLSRTQSLCTHWKEHHDWWWRWLSSEHSLNAAIWSTWSLTENSKGASCLFSPEGRPIFCHLIIDGNGSKWAEHVQWGN